MHIATIRRNGLIDGYQLPANGSEPGTTRFFASKKHGGAEEAQGCAGYGYKTKLPETGPRGGGSPEGRVTRLSRTGAVGIRFVWGQGAGDSVGLAVVATWTDKTGTPNST